MEIARTTRQSAFAARWRLVFLWWVGSCALLMVLPMVEASAGMDATAERNDDSSSDDFDEDLLVKETIAAGRGDRDEQGIRDQWQSDEHLGEENVYDSRKPISDEVKRLLKIYRLDCKDCDHSEAVKKVNAYVKETKRLNKLAREQAAAAARRDSWARNLFAAIVVAALSAAYVYKKELGLEVLFQSYGQRLGGNRGGVDDAQRAEFLRQKRHQAAEERNKQRPQTEKPPPPTWLENEQKEIWTPKQEKQFQTALREFSGVPKKERYKLIAEKVNGKSRIECLTHLKMQELLAKYNEEQQQQ